MRFVQTTSDIAEQLRQKANKLHRTGGGKLRELRDRVARGAGYNHWNHVEQCLSQSSDSTPEAASAAVSTYSQIANKVAQVLVVFEKRCIALHGQSILAQIFNDARTLADSHETEIQLGHSIQQLFAMMHAGRIADAILGVADEAFAQDLLKRIASKDMDLALRSPSQGKDALWELELLGWLRRKGAHAWLQEPDIVVSVDGTEYPIACKKINSEAGTKNQMRSACRQLRTFGSQGIVALNIDELVPENNVLRGPNAKSTGSNLQKIAEDYLDRHRLEFQEAIAGEKCDAIIISITAPVEHTKSRPRWNYQTETIVWSTSDKNELGRDRLMQLGRIIAAPAPIHRP